MTFIIIKCTLLRSDPYTPPPLPHCPSCGPYTPLFCPALCIDTAYYGNDYGNAAGPKVTNTWWPTTHLLRPVLCADNASIIN